MNGIKVINAHRRKRKGRSGITIHLLRQGGYEYSKTITVHGTTINALYEKLMFFLKSLQESKEGVEIIIR